MSTELLWFVHCSSWGSSEASDGAALSVCAGGHSAGLQWDRDSEIRQQLPGRCSGERLQEHPFGTQLCTWIFNHFPLASLQISAVGLRGFLQDSGASSSSVFVEGGSP